MEWGFLTLCRLARMIWFLRLVIEVGSKRKQ